MDNIWDKNRFSNYFLTMANLEANQLYSISTTLSLIHLKDGMVRMKFQDDIQAFINANLQVIRSSKSDDECQACIHNIKTERENLTLQDRMLRSGEAAIHASVKFYHDHGKIIGYFIDAIGIVTGGIQIYGGGTLAVASLVTGNVIGVIAGVTLVANGLSNTIENLEKLAGFDHPKNYTRDLFEDSAQFLGFDKRVGLLAYQAVDFSTSYYGMLKLTLKPQAWRLWEYVPSDYYRQVQLMSKSALALSGVGAILKAGKIGINMHDIKEGKK